jgi:hypothetical protein
VPRELTAEYKTNRKGVCTMLLEPYKKKVRHFKTYSNRGEKWFHHFEPESIRQSKQWEHLSSPETKLKAKPSAVKTCLRVLFGNSEGSMIEHYQAKCEIVNSEG